MLSIKYTRDNTQMFSFRNIMVESDVLSRDKEIFIWLSSRCPLELISQLKHETFGVEKSCNISRLSSPKDISLLFDTGRLILFHFL